MINNIKIKTIRRERRRLRSKKRIYGTADRPRMVIFRSNYYFYVQLIDDEKQHTICSASTLKSEEKLNIKTVEKFGEEFAKQIVEKGIKTVRFDRNGYLYHGKIKVFAEKVRQSGVIF